ncbi:MAG: Hcp family type VI secretion system effector [Thalassobaculaceae bacterium]|nr:Hcp family type VI secretion system effector [Thalassobaculaceae bacterium]
MPTPAYMTIEGANQGDMSSGAMSADSVGTLSVSSQENKMQIQEFELGISVPTDPQSGQPTGRRVHTGCRIVKYLDKASPLILQAIATGEQLTKVKVEFYRTASTGSQELYYTVELDEATLVSLQPYFPMALDGANSSYGHMEELKITYKKIAVTHEVAGTSGGDDWNN